MGSLLKNIERLQRFDYLVQHACTGCPADFAKRMGMSRSSLYDFIDQVKLLGAEIDYCKTRKTFFYVKPLPVLIATKAQRNIIGGNIKLTYNKTAASENTGQPLYTFGLSNLLARIRIG